MYALRECFNPLFGLTPTPANVYGVLSLILWSLIIVVSVKYLAFVMRADNNGEGGILALVALINRRNQRANEQLKRGAIISIGLIGAALLYGDGIITPAISVLGATEGLSVVTPLLGKLTVPLTVVIIFLLFFFQSRGTAKVGRIFGPIMFLWFVVIAALGIKEIAVEPEILLAANPWYGVRFFLDNGFHAFVILGAVVLVVTGSEALYADMGHFGKRPIRLAWFALVLPSLVLNYFGQGGLLLHDSTAFQNPFYMLAPRVLLYPMIALSTVAAVIASQALISGAFSLTNQCVQLGYCPRVSIRHTSAREFGQIYVPEVNAALMVGCLLIVLGFRSSSALGAAYGIAVTGTFAITSVLLFVVARAWWNWSLAHAIAISSAFLIVDLAFFGANILKIREGGWVPLAVAAGIYILMTTWNRGRKLIERMQAKQSMDVKPFLEDIARKKPVRVPGLAVFMARTDKIPVVLLHHMKHNKVFHQKVVLLSIKSVEVPTIPDEDRIKIESLGEGFYRIIARYGFMETPNVLEIMRMASTSGVHATLMETTFYLGREELIPTGRQPMPKWRKRLFGFMSRNAQSATKYFGLPPNRVVELGAQIEF